MAIKSLYTKKLGQTVANSAQPLHSGRYHVISTLTVAYKWVVVPDGSVHAIKAFSSQIEAVNYASQSASKKTGEVVIHGKMGQVSNKISFAKK